MSQKIRVGIAGLDHFYAGLGALDDLRDQQDAEVVVVAHRDERRGREAASKAGARWTDDYASVLDEEIDLLITACRTVENAALVAEGARRGRHILSVKPFAMNLDEADQVVAAVKEAGVHFMSYDASYRVNPLYAQTRTWIKQGELGRPLTVFAMMRSSLPTLQWFSTPPEHGRTWWLDPTQSPGGGWIDHSIYYVDGLRWLLDAEVVRVSGETAKLKHPDEALEDFGVANMVFSNGVVATVEVTWTIERGGFATAFHLVADNGHLLVDSPSGLEPSIRRVQYDVETPGWQNETMPSGRGSLTTHMLDVIRGKAEPLATVDDSRATLAACLAFYQAAREQRTVEL
jgi:predicted dehydrogenase